MNKPTVGQVASELLNKHKDKINPQEIQRAQENEYLANLEWCVKHALKKVDCSDVKGHEECVSREPLKDDFFVSVLLKKEEKLENVIRNYFIATKECPTPTYDQTLYKYDYGKDQVEFLWVIPDRETCLTFKENVAIIVPEERGLLNCVLSFYDGTYYRMMKKFNGEEMHLGGALIGA